MLRLVMGAFVSSSEDEEEEEDQPKEQKQGPHGDSEHGENLVDTTESELRTITLKPVDRQNLNDRVPHRLPSPTREQGDGREAGEDVDNTPASAAPPLSYKSASCPKMIHLPQTNIALEKLPPLEPISSSVELPHGTPTKTTLYKMASVHPPARKSNSVGARKDKGPKFVPYEPYKAAVTPMVAVAKTKVKIPGTLSKKCLPAQIEDAEAELKSPNRDTKPELAPQLAVSSPDEKLPLQPLLSRHVVVERDAEVASLRRELDERNKQLRIQTQVNTEVKRLLVASVGEDIEAKVDFLTQDKARLTADIRQFATKISRDFEEKEQLSVESNLWKSKFLACSVIIDELARSKASLQHRGEQYEHQVRLLQHEHSVLWRSLADTNAVLSRLKSAFDPLTVLPEPFSEVASVLGLAENCRGMAEALRERLVGSKAAVDLKTASPLRERVASSGGTPVQIDTPAEEGLRELLAAGSSVEQTEGDYSAIASVAVTGAARTHLMKLGDKLQAPQSSSSFKNCTHCQGTVQNI